MSDEILDKILKDIDHHRKKQKDVNDGMDKLTRMIKEKKQIDGKPQKENNDSGSHPPK